MGPDQVRRSRLAYGKPRTARPPGPGGPCPEAISWRFAAQWGTPNFINKGRNCGAGSLITETAMYGWDTVAAGFDPDVTKCLAMWGSNFAESNPIGWRRYAGSWPRGS
jgi:thiosulfate reductase / polysulfide reductase chain A